MKIAMYFNRAGNATLDIQAFKSGAVGMNGTHGQFFLLLLDLFSYPGIEVVLFSPVPVVGLPEKNYFWVKDVDDAFGKVKEGLFDLIIFNNRFNEETSKAIELLDILKLPGILWDQNGPYPQQERLLTSSKYLKRIICVSSFQCQLLRHRAYFNKVTFIYNGKDYADPENNAHLNEAPAFCFIGAPTISKGFHWVCRSWPKVKKQLPGATLTIAGSMQLYNKTFKSGPFGIADDKFEQTFMVPFFGPSAEVAFENGIRFAGMLNPSELNDLLKNTNVGIVNPNTRLGYETFCVSAIDFQGNGVPVIGGRQGGLYETVKDGITGILIPKAEKLHDGLIKIYSLTRDKNTMGQYGSQWVREQFSRKLILSNWLSLFESVLLNKNAQRVPLFYRPAPFRILANELLRMIK